MSGKRIAPPALGVAETGIRRAAVIGAGAMGGGIAAQFANAGVPVDLLDVASPTAADGVARAGIERQLKAGGFMHPDAAGLVRPGNVDDDLGRLADADWIVEAVVENIAVKRDLFARIEAVRRPGTIVSTNTSTIPRADIVAGMPAAFAPDFLVTHFFNPPRHMPLVEFVGGEETDPSVLARARAAAATVLGKTIVTCRDTPGFIANRVGCYWLAVAVVEATELGVTPEEADAVMQACGLPRTGAFGLMDLIGIDLVPQVWGSLMAALPATDELNQYDLPGHPVIAGMLQKGRFGRKAKAGFYRLGADRSSETLDLETGEYRPQHLVAPKSLPGGGRDLGALLASTDRLGSYGWRVLSRVISYTASIGAEIAEDVAAVDLAMVLGYAWREGPFRLADRIGAAQVAERLQAEGRLVPPLLAAAARSGGFFAADGSALRTAGDGRSRPTAGAGVSLAAIKRGASRIIANHSASLWDSGEGVAVFEMHTKLNSFAPAVFDILEETLARGGNDFRALVLGNDDPRAFSAGADLSHILDLVRAGDTSGLAAYIARGQRAFLAMKYAAFPVVAAAHGLALGGGCEFTLHADAIIAHAEYSAGLPETRVGLVPGWGGCTQLLLRQQQAADLPRGPLAPALRAFAAIMDGAPSSSALEARARGLLRPTDAIVMNRDHLLAAARRQALAMAHSYVPPAPAEIVVAGPSGRQILMNEANNGRAAGRLTAADVAIAEALATVLTGGADGRPEVPSSEQALMQLELEALVGLSGLPATEARIEHMLATGKPLRN